MCRFTTYLSARGGRNSGGGRVVIDGFHVSLVVQALLSGNAPGGRKTQARARKRATSRAVEPSVWGGISKGSWGFRDSSKRGHRRIIWPGVGSCLCAARTKIRRLQSQRLFSMQQTPQGFVFCKQFELGFGPEEDGSLTVRFSSQRDQFVLPSRLREERLVPIERTYLAGL